VRLGALINRAVLVAIATAITIVSLRTLVSFASNADISDLSTSLERGLPLPEANYFARFVQTHGLDRSSAECGDLFTRASLTVTLAALEAATEQKDANLTDIAERNAIRAASHRLSCNPLDGNAWLRYAIVSARRRGPMGPIVDQLRLSYETAPNEAWVIEPRLGFATNLYLAGAVGFETEYLNDLRLFTSFESVGQVAATYVKIPPRARVLLGSLIDSAPEPRRKAITAEIDRLSVDISNGGVR
jgi:hypothetical protein